MKKITNDSSAIERAFRGYERDCRKQETAEILGSTYQRKYVVSGYLVNEKGTYKYTVWKVLAIGVQYALILDSMPFNENDFVLKSIRTF